MENIEYIDDYFNSSGTDEQKKIFEQKIINDSLFAEEVAFYIAANGAVKEEADRAKKLRFKEIYRQRKEAPVKKMPVRNVLRYLSAACVVGIIMLATGLLTGGDSAQQLADKYIQVNFATVGVKMDDKQDSLQDGFRLYNNGLLPKALEQFAMIIKNDSTNATAIKYAGVVCLKLKNYDKALQYFDKLENNTLLYSNPGKFYKALTLIERNKKGDKEAAKILLKDVVDKNMEGKEEAEKLLKKL